MLDWIEFNRELQNRVSDAGMRYVLGLMYERLLETSKQQDATNELMLQFANSMQQLVGLNEALDQHVNMLKSMIKGDRDGVSVQSVPLTND